MSTESWASQQARQTLFRGTSLARAALNLLKRDNEVNRTITPAQAQGLHVVTFLAERTARVDGTWSWVATLPSLVSELQMSTGQPQNARMQFLEAHRLEVEAEVAKSRRMGAGAV